MRYALTGLEQGYETYLGKQCGVGTNLSGGEWQRVGLSRAYMRDAGVVSRCGRLTSRISGPAALPKEAPVPTRQQAEQFETDGYFIADDAVESGMFDELAAAARRVKQKVRSGQVDVYTHWATDENSEPWAIRGLLAPEFDEPVFAEYLASGPVMEHVHAFIGDDLTMGSILVFTNPHHADYSIGWHRDWGKLERDLDYDAEMAVLGKPLTTWRWHLATVDDECLQIVPGSHRRYRTLHERRCLIETRHDDIPGQLSIRLKAGQAVYWSGDTIHRGLNRKDTERLTVSAGWSVHDAGAAPQPVDERLRWRLRDDVRANLPADLVPYYDHWRAKQLA